MKTARSDYAQYAQQPVQPIGLRSQASIMTSTSRADEAQGRPVHLTPRELEVLALLGEGLPNKLISRRLEISSATVKCHISRILSELGVSSRLQAVVAAARCGLLTDSGQMNGSEAAARLQGTPSGMHGSSPMSLYMTGAPA